MHVPLSRLSRLLPALLCVAALFPARAAAQDLEPHKWCLQTHGGNLKQEIAREIIRRLNRRLYLQSPSTQLEREDEEVHVTVGIPRGAGTEDNSRVLLEVAVGPVVERNGLTELLGDSLLISVLRRNYLWIDETPTAASGVVVGDDGMSIGQITAFKTLKDVFWWSPTDYQLSATQGFARFSDRAGLFVEFGNDELGYPLWNSGSFRAGIAHEFVKVWIQSPLIGTNSSTFFVTRKLDGAIGAGAAFDVGTAGGEFAFADISSSSTGISVLDSANIHYISNLAQAYYILGVPIATGMPGTMRLKFGGGFHQVVTAYISVPDGGRIIKRDRGTYRGGPYLRAEFISAATQGGLPLGEGFLQFYNGSLMVGGAYNFLRWLGVEAKISVIFSPDAWERGVMYELSPRIRI